jgi:hypothetical protein
MNEKSKREENAHKISPIEVERYLKGISFPASRDDLIKQAQENNSPSEILEILKQFADHDYESVADVAKEISKVEQ